MRHKQSLLSILFFFIQVWSQDASLVITAVFDGPLSGGLPKGIEVYVSSNIADLSDYGLGSANNGNGSDGEEFTFSATSASLGDYLYIASDSIQFSNFFGFAPNYTTSAMVINGDDAIELYYQSRIVDVFGEADIEGSGTIWEYTDGWAYRRAGTGPDTATFQPEHWIFSGPGALADASSNATAAKPVPIATYTASPIDTVKAEPDAQASAFSIFAVTSSSLRLTWQAAVLSVQSKTGQLPDAYLITGRCGEKPFAQVEDGKPLTDDATWHDSTFALNIAHHQGGDTIEIAGLEADQRYDFRIYAYTNSGAEINFKTDSVPQVSAQTLAELPPFYAISEIQDTTRSGNYNSQFDGQRVRTSGVIYARFEAGYWLQSGAGPYSGIYVADDELTLTGAVGDSVVVAGIIATIDSLILIHTVSELEVFSGGILPQPAMLSCGELASGGGEARKYQSVFVQVNGEVIAIDSGVGTCLLADESGEILVDDLLYTFSLGIGQHVSVSGPLFFAANASKILPRQAGDIAINLFPEPTHHVSDFAASRVSGFSARLTWTESVGGQEPHGYLLLLLQTGLPFDEVTDGIVRRDWSWDGIHAAKNVVHSGGGKGEVLFKLDPNLEYEISIYPYTNSGEDIDYKTDGGIPTVTINTALESWQPVAWSSGSEAIIVARESGIASEGEHAAILYWTSQDNQDFDSEPFAVLPGDSFAASVDILDSDDGGRARLAIIFSPGSDIYAGYSTDSDSFQTLSAYDLVPEDAETAILRLRLYDVAANWDGNSVVFLDNARFSILGETTNRIANPGLEEWSRPIEVNILHSIKRLREQAIGDDKRYLLRYPATITHTAYTSKQLFLQGDTAGIMINDSADILSYAYAPGDVVSGFTGYLNNNHGMLQFIPTEDAGPPERRNALPTAEKVTISSLKSNFSAFDSRLIRIDRLLLEAAANWGDGDHLFAASDDGGDSEIQIYITDSSGVWDEYPLAPEGEIDMLAIPGFHTETEEFQLLPVEILRFVNVDENKTLPQQFTVAQNYPNPFNPSTIIAFTLPRSERVDFMVYNAGGQLVYQEWRLYPAGAHQLNFQASLLASGVYFYELKAGKNRIIKKMILLR
jgi:hypothetical protein